MKKKIILGMIVLVFIVSIAFNRVYVSAATLERKTEEGRKVAVGGSITYSIGGLNDTLSPGDVILSGGTANISVQQNGDGTGSITFSNIQGAVGSRPQFYVRNHTDASVPITGKVNFILVAPNNPAPAPTPAPTPSNNNNNTNVNTNTNYNNNYNNNQNNNQNNNEENNEEKPKEEPDNTPPTMSVSDLSQTAVKVGEDISFDINYSDDKEIQEITLKKEDITLYGFTADINITGDGNTRKVSLTNIQGNLGGLKYVKIASNTAKDKSGNLVQDSFQTKMFKIQDNSTKNMADDWIENPNTGR